jgi:hypothetical protein
MLQRARDGGREAASVPLGGGSDTAEQRKTCEVSVSISKLRISLSFVLYRPSEERAVLELHRMQLMMHDTRMSR